MILESDNKIFNLDIRGEFGYSNGFGAIKFSWNRFGLRTDLAGIYQRKKTLKGWRVSRMAFFRTANPQTVAQQAWRAVFAAGLVEWRTLSDDQKNEYRKRGRKYRMTGFNLFQREYLRSH